MSKRKPLDKEQARERRNRMLESAASAKLSLTEGVREMRAISGLTQDDFARHRGVSARVIKALELGQGNPTVATMNRIGEFFGLEVGFIPIQRSAQATDSSPSTHDHLDIQEVVREMSESFETRVRAFLDSQLDLLRATALKAGDAHGWVDDASATSPTQRRPAGTPEAETAPVPKKPKPRAK